MTWWKATISVCPAESAIKKMHSNTPDVYEPDYYIPLDFYIRPIQLLWSPKNSLKWLLQQFGTFYAPPRILYQLMECNCSQVQKMMVLLYRSALNTSAEELMLYFSYCWSCTVLVHKYINAYSSQVLHWSLLSLCWVCVRWMWAFGCKHSNPINPDFTTKG